jgi:chromosome partitioning protein
MPPHTVAFINYKGGVGKTTSTYHVACSLAGHHKKRVLLIDIDPQTNLSFLCAPYEDWKRHKDKSGTVKDLYSKWLGKKPLAVKAKIWRDPIRVLGSYRITGLDLIPCDVDLIGEDLGGGQVTGTFPTVESLKRNSEAFLRERGFIRAIISEVATDYDYVLIDCPPNLYLMTQNALAAADHYIITAVPDHLSTIGLSILREKVDRIGKLIESARTFAARTGNDHVVAQLGGVIFVKVRIGGMMTTHAHSSKMAEIAGLLPKMCFDAHTTELIGYSEAAEASVPVWALATDNAKRAASKGEYQSIAKEFLKRFP